MQKMSQSNYASSEIFAAVFGPNVCAADVLAEDEEGRNSIVEAREQALEAVIAWLELVEAGKATQKP